MPCRLLRSIASRPYEPTRVEISYEFATGTSRVSYCSERPARLDLGELERPVDAKGEPPAADALELDAEGTSGQALAEHEQPRLEVLAPSGEAEALVEPQLAVGEGGAAGVGVLAQEPPEDPAGHALDHVLVADEDAVVGLVVRDAQHRTGRGGRRGRRLGSLRLEVEAAQGGGEVTREHAQQPLAVRPEPAGFLALEVQDARHLAAGHERSRGHAPRALEAGQRDLVGGC